MAAKKSRATNPPPPVLLLLDPVSVLEKGPDPGSWISLLNYECFYMIAELCVWQGRL
jgi:hypothetical protein